MEATEAVRRQVFELYGAEYQTPVAGDEYDGERCPGESRCGMFAGAIQETGRGLDACDGCDLIETKPGFVNIGKIEPAADSEIDLMVSETEQLINDENAGFAIDWDFHDPELYTLVVEWRRAEREIERERAHWHHLWIKGQFKEK